MKSIEIAEYPDAFIEASQTFLNNPELLSVFVTMIFKKTNVYDSRTMECSFDLVTKWFNVLEKMNEPFPSNFDFNFYLKGIQVSLDKIDHNCSTTKVLWHIYKTLQYFPIEQKI